ncbi:hypothetical protein D3C72_2139170 [compost metagenome]
MGRISLAQRLDDQLLSGAIDLGHVILGIFLVDRDDVQAFDRAENHFTGATGCAQGDIQHGLHGRFTWVVKESRQY